VPRGAWQSSVYVKVRGRAAYAFALTSAAVALRLDGDGGRVADVRIVLGGLATKPWRCHDAEALLQGRPLTLDTATAAATACLAGARADDAREFTVDLGRRTVVRALLEAGRRASP
jgi:xanthine dehydrogenase YagS FAD-binding subunit